MSISRKALALALSTIALSHLAQTALAEESTQSQDNQPRPVENGGSQKDIIGLRINRQQTRIKQALQNGLITEEQALQLRSAVEDIQRDFEQLVQSRGGNLKSEDFKQVENSLNQMSAQIRTVRD